MIQLVKKGLLTFFFIAFLMSLFHDLTVGTFDNSPAALNNTNTVTKEAAPATSVPNIQDNKRYEIAEHKVKNGEVVLSIIESLNPNNSQVVNLQKIEDFKALNEGVDPNNIQAGKTYLFPVYTNQNPPELNKPM